jgi:hypothetical protein
MQYVLAENKMLIYKYQIFDFAKKKLYFNITQSVIFYFFIDQLLARL